MRSVMGQIFDIYTIGNPSTRIRQRRPVKKGIFIMTALAVPLNANRIYFCSPVNALVEWIYQQKISLREIKQHGNFGLGTC